MSDGEQADDAQKTEEPTAKRLEQSRKKGEVALSREVNNWVMIFAATILIATMSTSVLGDLKELLKAYIEHSHDFPSMPGGLHIVLGEGVKSVFIIMAMPLMLLMAAAFLSPFIQIGPLFAPEAIKPSLSKVSPIKGLKRLFSKRSLMEFLKGVLKLSIVGAIGVIIVSPYFDRFEHLIDMPVGQFMDELKMLVVRVLSGILVVLIVVAVIDLVFQRMEHHKKMRMTKQEVKDEFKQAEGDPHVKAKLRQLRSEKARQRMIQAVPEADVVITNPTHFSIALKYKPDEMTAPLCVAKGMDELALRIREVAKEHQVEIVENVPLARALYDTMEVNDSIPGEHFKAVAEVISYVFKKQGRLNS